MRPSRRLVAGDKDYVPVIEKLRRRDSIVDVVFWAHAARKLKEAATSFIPLNAHLDHLRRK